jgi:hypothetical protein
MTEQLIIQFLWIGAGVFAGILILATVVKLREVWHARHWLTASGRVISSKVESRRRTGVGDTAATLGNFAAVSYEYKVGGRHYTGKRISIGEQAADVGVEIVLDRYPKGAAVDVFYNPANPQQAVLERDLPPNFGKTIGGLLAFVLGAAIIVPIGLRKFTSRIGGYLDRPENAAVVALLLGMATFVALIAIALQRQQRLVGNWPATAGTVVEAAVEARRSNRLRSSGNTYSVVYRPRITYAYEVRGREYRSERLRLGGQTSGMMIGWLRRFLYSGRDPAVPFGLVDSTGGEGDPDHIPPWVVREVGRYRQGARVVVYYNPASPAEAVLEKRLRALPLLWTVAAALLLLALAAAGIIGR